MTDRGDPDNCGPASTTCDTTLKSSAIKTVTITISEVNDPPVAVDDSRSVAEDGTLTFPASDLVANDSAGPANESGQTLTVVAVASTPSTHGSVSLVSGQITYTPAANYNGPASFSYTVRDNGTTNGAPDPREDTGTVDVTVTAADDNPTVTVDENTVTVDEGQEATNSGTFGDIDGDTVILSASVGTVTGNPDGTWDWSFDTSDGPDDTQVVTITASDGGAPNATVTFQLNVSNVAPDVTAADDQSSDEGETKSFDLGSFTDPGADGPWSVEVAWGDGSPHTTFTKATPGSLGTKSHKYADNGVYTVTVTVTEAGSGTQPSDSDSFDVTVHNVAPTVVLTGAEEVDEGDTETYNYTVSDPGVNDTFTVDAGFPDCDSVRRQRRAGRDAGADRYGRQLQVLVPGRRCDGDGQDQGDQQRRRQLDRLRGCRDRRDRQRGAGGHGGCGSVFG